MIVDMWTHEWRQWPLPLERRMEWQVGVARGPQRPLWGPREPEWQKLEVRLYSPQLNNSTTHYISTLINYDLIHEVLQFNDRADNNYYLYPGRTYSFILLNLIVIAPTLYCCLDNSYW